MGQALARLGPGSATERERAAVVARAGEEGLEGYRFRMEDDFTRLALSATETNKVTPFPECIQFGLQVRQRLVLRRSTPALGGHMKHFHGSHTICGRTRSAQPNVAP